MCITFSYGFLTIRSFIEILFVLHNVFQYIILMNVSAKATRHSTERRQSLILTKDVTMQTLTPNQVKRLELIRNSIITIHDSPEFAKMDYYPDLTLGDAAHAIEELILECQREEPQKPVMHLTITRKFSLVESLGKTMLTSFFACGFFACAALFSNGLNEVNHTRFSIADNVDWESIGEVTTGLSMASLAISGTCALTITIDKLKEEA